MANAWSYSPVEVKNAKLSAPVNMSNAKSRNTRCYKRRNAVGANPAGSMGSSHKVEDSLVGSWTPV